MVISKSSKTGEIRYLPETGHILVLTVTRIVENGEEIANSLHRTSYSPGDDVSQADPQVQSIAKQFWTKQVVADYKAMIETQNAKLTAGARR